VLQRLRDAAQAVVAGQMAVVIVVFLEVVDIDEHERHRRGFALGAAPDPGQFFVKITAVGDPGEAIHYRQFSQLLAKLD